MYVADVSRWDSVQPVDLRSNWKSILYSPYIFFQQELHFGIVYLFYMPLIVADNSATTATVYLSTVAFLSIRFDSKSEKRLEYDTARDHSQLARCIKLRESAHNYIWIVLFLSSTISWILEFDLYSGFDRKIKQQPKQKQ